ncbi:MAG: DUF2141 domain-containing protein [Bacteroidota bacterium]
MKTLALTLSLFAISFISFAQEAEGITITVTVDNVLNDNGKVMAGLHTADTFMKAEGIKVVEGKITEGKVILTFENVLPGSYAIMAMHDENENNQMDYQSNGMPKESYGMSGNDMSFGPPTFTDAQFEVTDKDLEFSIRF